jgi:hypothetical protein
MVWCLRAKRLPLLGTTCRVNRFLLVVLPAQSLQALQSVDHGGVLTLRGHPQRAWRVVSTDFVVVVVDVARPGGPAA